MVTAWTNTDIDLIIPLFEQYKKDNGEKIMVESYCQTMPIRNEVLYNPGKEDEKLWNEVELIQSQNIMLAPPDFDRMNMIDIELTSFGQGDF